MNRAGIGIGGQTGAERLVGKHLGDLGEDFEMLLRDVIGNQQEDQQLDRLTVGGFEWDGILQAHKGGQRRLQSLDAAVRDRDPMAEAAETRAKASALLSVLGSAA